MSQTISLTATKREKVGKGASRALRKAGYVPAVIYGAGQPPIAVNFELRALKQQLTDSFFFTRLIDLDVEGTKHEVLAREMQWHHITDIPLHLDLLRVDENTRVEIAVPVRFTNEALAPGLKKGGVLEVVRHEIHLICKAHKIPEHIDIDLTGLDFKDSVHVRNVTLPEDTVPTIERNFTIATIKPPKGAR